jgi:hypothetical protein
VADTVGDAGDADMVDVRDRGSTKPVSDAVPVRVLLPVGDGDALRERLAREGEALGDGGGVRDGDGVRCGVRGGRLGLGDDPSDGDAVGDSVPLCGVPVTVPVVPPGDGVGVPPSVVAGAADADALAEPDSVKLSKALPEAEADADALAEAVAEADADADADADPDALTLSKADALADADAENVSNADADAEPEPLPEYDGTALAETV